MLAFPLIEIFFLEKRFVFLFGKLDFYGSFV